MRRVKSCGILLFRESPRPAFLLMKHHDRYDLPKGRVERGETELECAYRETREETGVRRKKIKLDPDFRFVLKYRPRSRSGEQVEKTLVMFLGWVGADTEINPVEHPGYEWIEWDPPHAIQAKTIDPLLAAVAEHFAEQ